MKNLLKDRNIFLICIGGLISSIGDNLYNIGLTLSMYSLSGSISAVAGMWLIRALIRIPGQFLGGILADKYNRKKISVIVNLFSAIICFMFVFVNDSNMVYAYFLIFLLQGTSDIDVTANVAILPELVEKDKLEDVNSVFSLLTTIALFISPALAGAIYMKYGATILYVINSISFLWSAIMFSMITYKKEPNKKFDKSEHKFTLFNFAKEGYTVIKNDRLILRSIYVMMFFAILGRFYEIYKVYIADQILGVGSVGIVYFSYAMALGSLLTPILVKFIKRKNEDSSKLFLMVSIVSGTGFLIWGIASNLILSCIAVFIIGVFQTAMSIFINSIIQKNVSKECIGRVFSFYKIAIVISASFGIVVAPTLLNILGVKFVISMFSILSIISIIFMIMSKNVNSTGTIKNIER